MKKGFTLAEVLITLGIIGVVAALVLPQLIAHYKDMVIINKTKKVYSAIEQALKLAQTANGVPGDNGGLFSTENSSKQVADELSKFFAGSKVCAVNSKVNGCAHANYFIYRGVKTASGGLNVGSSYTSMILSDGTILYLATNKRGCLPFVNSGASLDADGNLQYDEEGNLITWTRTENSCGEITFDVNGPSKPNQYGHDTFVVYVFKDYIKPDPYWSQATGGTSLKNILAGKKNPFVYYKYKN